MLLIEIELVKEIKSSEITWRNKNQIIIEKSDSQADTKMPLIQKLTPWKKSEQVKYEYMQFRLHQPLNTNKVRIDQADSILHDKTKILPLYQKQLWKLRARKGISRTRNKQEGKLIVSEVVVTKVEVAYIIW